MWLYSDGRSCILVDMRSRADTFVSFLFRYKETASDELRYAAFISMWVRWFVLLMCVVQINYRVDYLSLSYTLNTVYVFLQIGFNAYVHFRVASGRNVVPNWLFALAAIDIIAVTASVVVGNGFASPYFVLYYPMLAWFASVFLSVRLNLMWVTMAASIYAALSLGLGNGLDYSAQDEKALIARIVAMYAVVIMVNLISRSERLKRRKAVEREAELQRQRIELSQTIHDTTAQSAYMIGMGIETAMELADQSNRELISKLKSTYHLSRSTMWELRHPINMGLIFEGRQLTRVLESHAEAFTAITSIPVVVIREGMEEPPLSSIMRSALFTIAHNALTNAFRHSGATKVTIGLNFRKTDLRVSIADDGIGLPDDYARRGHGFRNMTADAERIGGSLEVKRAEAGRRTTISCSVQYGKAREVT